MKQIQRNDFWFGLSDSLKNQDSTVWKAILLNSKCDVESVQTCASTFSAYLLRPLLGRPLMRHISSSRYMPAQGSQYDYNY